MGITTILTSLMDRLEKVETKVDLMEKRLSLVRILVESTNAVRVVMKRIGSRPTKMMKAW